MSQRVVGEFVVRKTLLKRRGDKTEGHTHNFGHLTALASGALRIDITRPDGSSERVYLRPEEQTEVWVRAEDCHSLTALKPNTRYLCVYVHRGPDGLPTSNYTGWGKAYG